MPELTPQQRLYIRKRTRYEEPDPSEMVGELNIVPFLDITVNLIMFLLMSVAAIAFFTQITSTLPSYGRRIGGSTTKEQSLNLNVFITDKGVTVTGSQGKLMSGCQQVTAGTATTVPKVGNEFDWAGLTTCLENVKRAFPDESQVTLSADPEIVYESVVNAMDAVRFSGEDELFPEILLSAGVR